MDVRICAICFQPREISQTTIIKVRDTYITVPACNFCYVMLDKWRESIDQTVAVPANEGATKLILVGKE